MTSFVEKWHYSLNVTWLIATRYNTLQLTATQYKTLQHTLHVHAQTPSYVAWLLDVWHDALQHTATNCNTLQHTATHCNTRTASCATWCIHSDVTYCNTLQHATTHIYTRTLSCMTWLLHKARESFIHDTTLSYVTGLIHSYVKCLIFTKYDSFMYEGDVSYMNKSPHISERFTLPKDVTHAYMNVLRYVKIIFM